MFKKTANRSTTMDYLRKHAALSLGVFLCVFAFLVWLNQLIFTVTSKAAGLNFNVITLLCVVAISIGVSLYRSSARSDRQQSELVNGSPLLAPSVIAPAQTGEDKQSALAADSDNYGLAKKCGVGIATWNMQSGEVSLDSTLADLIGDVPELWLKASGNQWINRLHPQEVKPLTKLLTGVVEAGSGTISCELRLKHSKGHWVSFLVRGHIASRDDSGVPLEITGLYTNITESRRSDDRWRVRAELSADWFWQTDAQHNITERTTGVERLIGRKGKVASLRNFSETEGFFSALGAAQFLAAFEAQKPFKGLSYRTTQDGGEEEWIELDGRPIFDTQGVFLGYEGVGRNVTDKMNATIELQRSVATLNALISGFPLPIILKDLKGQYTRANESYCAMVGINASEIEGKTIDDFVSAEVAEKHREEDSRVLENRESLTYEVRQLVRGGGLVDSQIRKSPIVDSEGNMLGIAGVIVDLTAMRDSERALLEAKEAAEAANKAKSSFLATMSHEIRTPMNGVLGMAEMLSNSPLSEDQSEAVAIILKSASNLLTLIDDILDFSKIDAGRIDIEEREVNLTQTIFGVVDSLLPVALNRSVRLRAYVEPSLPELITTDETRLRQILNNLIGNAIKFSGGNHQKSGEVYVRVANLDSKFLRISVFDNGIGIDEENIARIFAPFTQAEKSTTRRFGGTGLGLAISKRLANMLGGDISIISEVGEGSIFRVDIPLKAIGKTKTPTVQKLENIHCVLVGLNTTEYTDLSVSLRHFGADIKASADIASALRICTDTKKPIVVLHGATGDSERRYVKEISALSWPEGVQHLLLSDGRRKSLRMLEEGIACVDWGPNKVMSEAVVLLSGALNQTIRRLDSVISEPNLIALPTTISRQLPPHLKVLVAEDDVINQRVIAKQFKHFGVQVEIVNNGREALDKWNKCRDYSILLTDLHMPEMDGYTLVRHIRAAEQAGEHLPILALTANAVSGETFEAYQAGVDLYLTKPIRLDDLYQAVSTFARALESNGTELVNPIDTKEISVDESVFEQKAKRADIVHFDAERLKAVIGDDPESMADMLEAYFDEAEPMVYALRTSLNSRNFSDSRSLAHRLKSASRSIGGLWLGEVCEAIEGIGNLHSAEAIKTLTDSVAQGFDSLQQAVRHDPSFMSTSK
jgi:PAS domain S-box-containing protein